jgi:peptidoglycan/xylan/chitin deacetylase (PgdA/CDA1 family)
MEDFLSWTSESSGLTRRKVIVLTFDDGYVDNYQLARPILEQLNIPYIIYVTSSFLDSPFQVPWWYALEEVLEGDWKSRLTDCPISTVKIKTRPEAFLFLRQAALDPNYGSSVVKWIYQNAASRRSSRLFMTWDECREISQSKLGLIGSHSVTHRNMQSLTDSERIFELRDSKNSIRSKSGADPKHFAYPYGSQNELFPSCRTILEYAGYDTGVSTCPAYYFEQSHYELPRMMLTDSRKLGDIEKILLTQAVKQKLKTIARIAN